jgi:hypothetical protein
MAEMGTQILLLRPEKYGSYLRTRMPAWSSHLSGYAALGSGDSFAESIVVPYFQSAGQIAMYRA